MFLTFLGEEGILPEMDGKFSRVMKDALIADSELAREAEVSHKTIKNLKNGKHTARVQTLRAVLEGLNRLLVKAGKKKVDSSIFGKQSSR
jgi:predicted transcriptional regulator